MNGTKISVSTCEMLQLIVRAPPTREHVLVCCNQKMASRLKVVLGIMEFGRRGLVEETAVRNHKLYNTQTSMTIYVATFTQCCACVYLCSAFK